MTATEEQGRPTPEQVDQLAVRHQEAKASLVEKQSEFDSIEKEMIDMVTRFGVVPPFAEKSRRLTGVRAELTVTRSDTLTVNDERVGDLKSALEANGFGGFFPRLFALRSKYEVVEGAEAALKAQPLPKRLTEKVLNLWGRCISVKPKKPSLRVAIADPGKPAKRAKKGQPAC